MVFMLLLSGFVFVCLFGGSIYFALYIINTYLISEKRYTGKDDGGIFPRKSSNQIHGEVEREASWAVVGLFSNVICCDNGVIKEEEIAGAYGYIKKRFNSSRKLCRLLDKLLKGKKMYSSMDCALAVSKAGVPYEARFELLEYLFKTAYAYEGICEQEIRRLRNIAKYLVIKDWDLLSLEYKYEYRKMESGKSRTDEKKEESRKRVDELGDSLTRRAYSVLGISSDATDEEVKTAYREIVKVCHPDKLTVPEGSKEWEESVVRFRQTNEAYELVCGKRGMA